MGEHSMHTHGDTISTGLERREKKFVELPKQLEAVPRAKEFPKERHRWNTNEEVAALLISFDKHDSWQRNDVQVRAPSGTMLLYSRKKVRYRKDGYCWKKRKDGKTTREDHMKLKVQGVECIYGCYVHSSILPTFHRRCYWLLQNPDIVLVHYLNVPYSDDNKLAMPSLLNCQEKKEWTSEELICQLRPMFASAGRSPGHSVTELMTEETVQSIVEQLMEQQQQKLSPGQQQDCSCLRGIHDKSCKLARQRMLSPKQLQAQTQQANITVIPQQKPITHLSPQGSLPVSTHTVTNSTAQATSHSHTVTATTPLILSLSQLQGHNGFIILSSQTAGTIPVVPSHTIQLAQSQVTGTVETQPAPESTTELVDPLAQRINTMATTQMVNSSAVTANASLLQNLEDQSNNNSVSQRGTLSDFIKQDVDTEEMDHQTSISPSHTNLDEMVSEFNLQDLGQTLQLSSEEVHKTLSANLPPEVSHSNHVHVPQNTTTMATPAIETVRTSMVSPQSADLNLETFDLLDIPDFDSESLASSLVSSEMTADATVVTSTPVKKDVVSLQPAKQETSAPVKMEGDSLVNITDFSPEWAFTEGGTKVLVTGPWFQLDSKYSIMFDGTSVPATLVQSGVLRCYCPAHSQGLVSLRVLCEGTLVSNPCSFEYKAKPEASPPAEKQKEWFDIGDEQLRRSLGERLQEVEKCLAAGQPPLQDTPRPSICASFQDDFERQMVDFCWRMKQQTWILGSDLIRSAPHRMTILHLAASLGYSQLITTLVKWREENPSLILEYEVDALSNDDRACTPLMWACAKGKMCAALTLFQWNRSALKVCNNDGLLPKNIAAKYGHEAIATQLERLDSSQIGLHSISHTKVMGQDGFLSEPLIDRSSQLVPKVSPGNQSPFAAVSSWQQMDLSIQIPPPPPYPGDTKLLQRKDSTASAPPMGSPGGSQTESDSITARRARLQKRISVDVLPNFPQPVLDSKCAKPDFIYCFDNRGQRSQSVGEGLGELGCDDPNLPVSVYRFTGASQVMQEPQQEHVAMETDQGSPYIDVEGLSEPDIDPVVDPVVDPDEASHHQMETLANQIIAAMPERIKASHSDDSAVEVAGNRERSGSHSSYSSFSPCVTPPPVGCDSGISTPLGDGIQFDEYRYVDLGTPASSLSPASTCQLQSPYSFTMDSPPPTTQEFNEYFNAPTTYMEKDFSKLTLSDQEQRKLYEAAKIIQHFYRRYKDKQVQKEREMEAAILIQSYYRRYKQYAYYKKMCHAAVLIQSQFRSYYAKKRFKRRREAATVIQNQYRAYKEHERFKKSRNAAVIIQQRFRSHYQRRKCMEAGRSQDPTVEASLRIIEYQLELYSHERHWPSRAPEVAEKQHTNVLTTSQLPRPLVM